MTLSKLKSLYPELLEQHEREVLFEAFGKESEEVIDEVGELRRPVTQGSLAFPLLDICEDVNEQAEDDELSEILKRALTAVIEKEFSKQDG